MKSTDLLRFWADFFSQGGVEHHGSHVNCKWEEVKGTIAKVVVVITSPTAFASTHTRTHTLSHINVTVSTMWIRSYRSHSPHVLLAECNNRTFIFFFSQSHLLSSIDDSSPPDINWTSTWLFSLSFYIRQRPILKTSPQLLRKDKFWHLWLVQFISSHKGHYS